VRRHHGLDQRAVHLVGGQLGELVVLLVLQAGKLQQEGDAGEITWWVELVGWLSLLVGWLSLLVGWLVGGLSLLVGWLVGWLSLLVGWLVGWLVG